MRVGRKTGFTKASLRSAKKRQTEKEDGEKLQRRAGPAEGPGCGDMPGGWEKVRMYWAAGH